MNKGGRPSKPAKLREGNNYSKEELQRLEKIEKDIQGDRDLIYQTPQHLDNLAKEYFNFIVSELEISDLLGNLDVPLIEQTADCLSKMRQCDEILNKEGVLIVELDRYGNEKRVEHPTVKTKNTYLNQFQKLSTQLGMSPSSRASLAAMVVDKAEEENNPIVQLLRSREG